MRAVTYARISTDLQSETSLQAQTHRAKQYAEMNGHEVIASYQDIGTGTKTEREGFQELMDTIDDWDIVIAYKLDRFHRSSANALAWATKLNGMGKNFAAMDIDVDTSTAMGMAIFKIITALNQMEVEVTRERTKMGLEGVKNAGRHVGRPPYGYDSVYARTSEDKDKGILEVNSEEADVVQTIFDLKNKEYSLSDIANNLTISGILTRSGKAIWKPTVIADILNRKDFYLGNYYDNDNELKEYTWEAILS